MAGVPPIGDISPTHPSPRGAQEPRKMDGNISSNNNNNTGVLCLNKFKPLPPISNIPGLNPDSEVIAAAEKKVFRTFKVLETDSAYVKLAKQGGRKNLLEYKEFNNEYLRKKESQVATKRKDAVKGENNNKTKIGNGNKTIEESNNNNNNNNNDIEWSSGNNNKENNNNNNNSNNNNVIKKKAFTVLKKKGEFKERPDILPVDQTEILKHLNAPKRPILPKIKHYPRLAARFVKVGGR
eukprot:gene458-10132_t